MINVGSTGYLPESERQTRLRRIDPRLKTAGWEIVDYDPAQPLGAYSHHAIREYPTSNGPADYALCVDGRVLGILEAKRLASGPQNVLTQAERYAEGLLGSVFDYGGLRAPFLYSSNGEIIWFHDVRHTLNRSRKVQGFHTPDALREMLARDFDRDYAWLATHPNDHPWLRPYQRDANTGMEEAIAARKRQMLVAMATGTGKTFTLVNEVYRLMKSGVARRILFLVDRRALAAQAVRSFASFEPEPGLKLNQIYEVYSQRLQRDDLDADFNASEMPVSYLTDPHGGLAYVYVCTIQRLAGQIFGRDAVFHGSVEPLDDDVTRLNIPIHAFDLVIADECHRGYTAADESLWRNTLDHFDAIRVGLTATPASHTTGYFKEVVYRYGYEQAVEDGFLVDYDAVALKSDVRLNGIFLDEGHQVGLVDTTSGATQLDFLEDQREFPSAEIEQKITAPDSNRKILEEIKRYADQHEEQHGRFPKTLIFAVNDQPHASHADQLVDLARDVFGRGDSFVTKITGRVDKPLQRIREFRNRTDPGIAVTVDLLTTGVDIPDLEYIVFLRPVKSRILFEQMLGRGTRKGERFPEKSHFTVFDCFDGTLLAYFRQATGITAEPPAEPTRTVAQIIDGIWKNQDREYNVRCLVKRLQRIDKEMAGDARADFAAFGIPDGDVARFAAQLGALLRTDFTGTMALLRDPAFQRLLVEYKRPPKTFYIAYGVDDTVSSEWMAREADGTYLQPEDYLHAFERFVRENPEHVEAIRILLDRPRDWNPAALSELRQRLRTTPERFTEDQLQKAHQIHYQRALVDVISMVQHAADEARPLLTAEERVNLAIARLKRGRAFTAEQVAWLDKVREHMIANLSIDRNDFDALPIFADRGGWGKANRVFDGDLPTLLVSLNEALAVAA